MILEKYTLIFFVLVFDLCSLEKTHTVFQLFSLLSFSGQRDLFCYRKQIRFQITVPFFVCWVFLCDLEVIFFSCERHFFFGWFRTTWTATKSTKINFQLLQNEKKATTNEHKKENKPNKINLPKFQIKKRKENKSEQN